MSPAISDVRTNYEIVDTLGDSRGALTTQLFSDLLTLPARPERAGTGEEEFFFRGR